MEADVTYPIYIILAHCSISAVLRIERSVAYVYSISGPSMEKPLVVDTESTPGAHIFLRKGSLCLYGSFGPLAIGTSNSTDLILCLTDTSKETREYWISRIRYLVIHMDEKVQIHIMPHRLTDVWIKLCGVELHQLMADHVKLWALYSTRFIPRPKITHVQELLGHHIYEYIPPRKEANQIVNNDETNGNSALKGV
jgi:hypothetical protein